jgi:hypothetical protein
MVRQAHSCHRCSGIVVETYFDLLSPDESGEAVLGWRCVNCGEYVDQQVLVNRSVQNQSSRAMPRPAQTTSGHRRVMAA